MSEKVIPYLPGIDRPRTPPEYGAKTAQAVLDLIRLHPKLHDQRDWIISSGWREECGEVVAEGTCGTTMCIAGWTQWLHEGIVDEDVVDEVARDYLGLEWRDADMLFHVYDAQAIAALEYVARGERINWNEVRSL